MFKRLEILDWFWRKLSWRKMLGKFIINYDKFGQFYERYFKSFASLIRSLQKISKWISNQKKLYLFDNYHTYQDIFHIDRWFVDASGIPHWVLLFDNLLLWGLSLVLVCLVLNLHTHWFIVDFVITFCTSYTTHILMWISLPKTFSSVKTE